MIIRVALRQRNSAIHRDRTVPVPVAGFELCDLPPSLRLVHAQAAVRVIHVQQPTSDYRTRAAVPVLPYGLEPPVAETQAAVPLPSATNIDVVAPACSTGDVEPMSASVEFRRAVFSGV